MSVGPVTVQIAAPPALVYQMLAAIGQGAPSNGERADILEDRDGVLIADFWTNVALPVGRDRLIRTRERVTLHPPDRIEYEHLDGPVRGLREEIRVDGGGGGTGTRLTYTGTYRPPSLWGRIQAIVLARPVIHRTMRAHFADVRERAEARASRSRVFASDVTESSQP